MDKESRTRKGKGVRFIVTGVIVNLVLFVVLELMLRTGLDYRIAVTVSYCFGMVWGYTQNRIWSWNSRSPIFASFQRYVFVYAVIYVLHILFVILLVEGLSVGPLLATFISALCLTVPAFIVLDRFVFSERVSPQCSNQRNC